MKNNIIFSLTYNIAFTVETVINSILRNSTNPEELAFHLIVPQAEAEKFQQKLASSFPDPKITITINPFTPPSKLVSFVTGRYSSKHDCRYMNYARFFLKEIFPDLNKVLYLDTDLVVTDDINRLFNETHFTQNQFYAAVPHTFWAPLYFKNPIRYRKLVKMIKQPFNGGVFLTDLSHWDESIVSQFYDYFELNRQSNYKMFSLSTEPLQNLLFHDYLPLDRRWNRCGFGNIKPIARLLKVPEEQISIIHWSGGVHKPWNNPRVPYHNLWSKYQLKATEIA